MDLNLSGQETKANQLRPYLIAFKNEIELRWPIWQRIKPERRKQWIQHADTKDPLFDLFVDVVKYARKWEIDDDG